MMYNVSHPRHQAGAVLGRYFHPGPSTRGTAQAGAGDHFTVTADGGSSVLTTAPVSAGTPHTLDISTHYIYTRYIYTLYTTLHWSHCHRKLGQRDTFA